MARKPARTPDTVIPGTAVVLPGALAQLLVPMAAVRADPRNPRRAKDLEQLCADFRAFGFTDPVVVDAGGMIEAGHMRFAALQLLGATHLPVVEVAHDPKTGRRYALAHNRASERVAAWDDRALAQLLGELGDEAAGLGWSDAAIRRLLQVETTSELEPVPTGPVVSEVGWLWSIGPHRVACGDCTDPAIVGLVASPASAAMVWTDLPYGIDYTGGAKRQRRIANDALDLEGLTSLARRAVEAWPLRPGGAFYVCTPPDPRSEATTAALRGQWRQLITWDKGGPTNSRSDYQWGHELIVYGWREGAAHHRVEDRTQTTVWSVDKDQHYQHPTQKPVELPGRAIRNSTDPGDLVFDGFCGSGSAGVAAAQLGRRFAGVDLDRRYTDLTVRRLVAATKLEAIATCCGEPVGRIDP
jgi:DNA modification methylase